MSDQFYREQAAGRARKIWLLGGAVLVIACLGLGIFNLFYDSCTRSFNRQPEQVVRSYIAAVSTGQDARARDCWQHDPYFDMEAGCSEACLASLSGDPIDVIALEVLEPQPTQDGRLSLPVVVKAACSQTGEQHEAEIVLETIGRQVPWRHWQIATSSFGGSLVDPWCE